MKHNHAHVAADQLKKVESALRQIERLKHFWRFTKNASSCNSAIIALEQARNELQGLRGFFAIPQLERKP